MNIYADLPQPILYVLSRALTETILHCENMQELFTQEGMPDGVYNWKNNQEYYQEHLDSVIEAFR